MVKVRITEGSPMLIEVYRNVHDAEPVETFESEVEYTPGSPVESQAKNGRVVPIGVLSAAGPQPGAGPGATAQPQAGS